MSETHMDVRQAPRAHGECRALADILMCIGDKWTVMVIGVLSLGRLRYSEIAKRIDGVSQRMLTLTLKALERDGLVSRTVYPTVPPKVEYELTKRGETLVVPLGALWTWARENRAGIEKSRRRHLAAKDSE